MKQIGSYYLRFILATVILMALVLPFVSAKVVEAYTGSYAKMQSITITDTSGTARAGVPVILSSIVGTTYYTSGYINSNGTNTAMTDNSTAADTKYMMDTTQSAIVVPNLPAYGSQSYNLLMGTSTYQTSFPIISGGSGNVTTPDNDTNLELSDNFSISVSGYMDTTAGANKNIVYKEGAFSIYVSDTVAENITAMLIDDTTQQLAPSGAGNETNIPILVGAATNWQANLTNDGDTSYVEANADGSTYRDTYATVNPSPAMGIITAVKVYICVREAFGAQEIASTALRTHGVTYNGATETAGGSYAYFSTTYTTNPNTSVVWTWDEINDMEIGVTIGNTGIGITRCTRVYAVVEYLFPVSVTATEVDSDEHSVEVWADTSKLYISVDGAVSPDPMYGEIALNGASVADSANNWTFFQNDSMPYADNISITIGGTERLYYAPNEMLTGTTVTDRSTDGVNNVGTLNWGSNSDLSISYGSVINAPAVQTDDASTVTALSAYLYGTLLGLGNYANVNVGFEWGQDTSYGDSTPLDQMTSAGGFYYPMTGLSPNTTYHYRAVMTYGFSYKTYGSDKSFTTSAAPGSSTTIRLRRAQVFYDYIVSGDMLLVVEIINNYTNIYPDNNPRVHFAIQLLDTDNSTILGASPLPNWGDRPASIYFNPTVVSNNITKGSAYYVKMIGDAWSSYAETEYTLVASTAYNTDWIGSDLRDLDSWCIGMAKNMGMVDYANQNYYLDPTPDRGDIINDAGVGYFTTGIPNIGNIRPNIFTTTLSTPSISQGTETNAWDSATAWQTFVGSGISADLTTIAYPLGIAGKDFLAGAVMALMLGCVMVVVGGTGGFGALGAVLISVPILWVGVFFRIVPAIVLLIMVIIFGMLAIRQFVIKTL